MGDAARSTVLLPRHALAGAVSALTTLAVLLSLGMVASAALGPAALFGLQAEAQLFGRAGRAAALRGGAALGLLTEPDWS